MHQTQLYEANSAGIARSARTAEYTRKRKCTHAVLEYGTAADTHRAGIKYERARKLGEFLPLCAYSVLEHSIFLKKIEVLRMLEFSEKSTEIQ